MKQLLQLEEAAMLALALVLVYSLRLPSGWWMYPVLLIGPDVSMLGYLVGPRAGAFTYNLFHHKGVGIALFVLGLYGHQPGLQTAGLILFGHSSMDRIFGFGLKFADDFKHTHLTGQFPPFTGKSGASA
ncbi:DUF4260 domain-containing protein [Dinghuibacter silviterrae]|uniref:Uncharacterized protein DUF4260 n=1 Tax=Dinghuibacter silviterrae TaxID=1539049 RepID=A0A4R8DRP0_9BACT|nr:DUF4260 domain-containing protein [Dinghuibacter silviterrae]TDW99810.1 uncharacterized protein DUF4260 [Dinghuibacter silviterrae]